MQMSVGLSVSFLILSVYEANKAMQHDEDDDDWFCLNLYGAI